MECPKRFPLNPEGDFYVVDGECMGCTAPQIEAPDLIVNTWELHCYFRRQPANADELQQAVMAVVQCCSGSVRYGGSDRKLIQKIDSACPFDVCDQL